MATAYCTILSTNYLPRALALAESLRRHEDGAQLRILFIDVAHPGDLPQLDGVEPVSTEVLGLPDREVLHLATTYDLVEFATAIKPLFLKSLLQDHEQVFYLDPDTYLLTPMVELGPALEATAGGILLTPHFLHPTSPEAGTTDHHMLGVGVYNLGFCGVDRRSVAFLDWWWGHLREECLFDPLSGLFVDQKWVDLGSTLFEAGSLRHSGYNTSVSNLSERPVARDADGYLNAANGERFRLFHFHAFDSSAPEKVTARGHHTVDHPLHDDSALLALCKEYAEVLSRYEQSLPAAPPYPYDADTRGKAIPRQVRRTYRVQSMSAATPLPLPFTDDDAAAWAAWRRRSWRGVSRGLLGESAKAARIILPEGYEWVKRRFPKLGARLTRRFGGGSGMWG